MKPSLLVATSNGGKLREVRRIIGEGYYLVSLADFPGLEMPEEDGMTFSDNAAKKALAAANQAGILAIADDSGLIVDALGGEPGVRSARYGAGIAGSDADRYRLLLRNLEGVPAAERGARFACSVALAATGSIIRVTEGVCEGHIAEGPRGDNGFGYDPVFVPSGYALTFAELDGAVKDSISHRFKALSAMKPVLASLLCGHGPLKTTGDS